MSDFDPEIAAARYRDLLEWIGEAKRHGRGWQRSAARILGVSPTYVSRVLSGNLSRVSQEVANQAAVAMGMDASWFNSDGSSPIRKFSRKGEDGGPMRVPLGDVSPDARLTVEGRARAQRLISDLFSMPADARVDAARELARFVLGTPIVALAREAESERDATRCVDLGLRLAAAILAEAVAVDPENRRP